MKKSIVGFAFLLFILSGCGPKMKPEEYNDVIISEQTKIMTIMLDMFDYIETGEYDKSEALRQQLVTQCEASVKAVKELPDYSGNTEMRDAAAELFTFYRDVTNEEYKEMIEILQKESIEVEDILKITALEADLSKREEAMDARFQAAQENFAKKHNLILTKNELQDDIDRLGE